MTDTNSDWQIECTNAAYEFAKICADKTKANSNSTQVLEFAVNTLMTELWDRYFSQTAIRSAYQKAIADMPRYTAEQEIRP